jgi:hypothetical protein
MAIRQQCAASEIRPTIAVIYVDRVSHPAKKIQTKQSETIFIIADYGFLYELLTYPSAGTICPRSQ